MSNKSMELSLYNELNNTLRYFSTSVAQLNSIDGKINFHKNGTADAELSWGITVFQKEPSTAAGEVWKAKVEFVRVTNASFNKTLTEKDLVATSVASFKQKSIIENAGIATIRVDANLNHAIILTLTEGADNYFTITDVTSSTGLFNNDIGKCDVIDLTVSAEGYELYEMATNVTPRVLDDFKRKLVDRLASTVTKESLKSIKIRSPRVEDIDSSTYELTFNDNNTLTMIWGKLSKLQDEVADVCTKLKEFVKIPICKEKDFDRLENGYISIDTAQERLNTIAERLIVISKTRELAATQGAITRLRSNNVRTILSKIIPIRIKMMDESIITIERNIDGFNNSLKTLPATVIEESAYLAITRYILIIESLLNDIQRTKVTVGALVD